MSTLSLILVSSYETMFICMIEKYMDKLGLLRFAGVSGSFEQLCHIVRRLTLLSLSFG